MKKFLRYGCGGCGLIVLLAIGLTMWASRNPIILPTPKGALPQLTGRQVAGGSHEVVVELRSSGSVPGFTVTSIDLPRQLASALGIQAPPGFKAAPLLVEAGDTPETVAFVQDFNKTTLRWEGRLAIPADRPVRVRFPASAPSAATGALSLDYERKALLGGMSAATQVQLNQVPSETLPHR